MQERLEIESVRKEASPDKFFWREVADIFLFYLKIFLAAIIFAAIFFFLYAGIRADQTSSLIFIIVCAALAVGIWELTKHPWIIGLTSRPPRNANFLEIMNHLERIKYPRLIAIAKDEVDRFKNCLMQLEEGKIVGPANKVFSMLADEVLETKESIYAVHVMREETDIKSWSQPPMNLYQKCIKKVAQEGREKRIISIFILSRNVAAHPEALSSIVNIMRQQKAYGVNIEVVWEYAVTNLHLFTDSCVVIDKKVVQHGFEGGLQGQATLSYNPKDIQKYYNKFAALNAVAKDFDKWLEENEQILTEPVIRPSGNSDEYGLN
jgi:hypothetical protein